MTIEIRQPELEALIQQRLKNSGFQNAEEVLLHALRSSPEPHKKRNDPHGKSLVDVCAMVRGLLTDEEIDTIFRRDPSPDRPGSGSH
jgi:hypothetical protein